MTRLDKKNIGILVFILIIFFGYIIINSKINTLTDKRYLTVSKEMKEQLKNFIDEKKEGVLQLSLVVSKNDAIKKALLTNDSSSIHLDELSLELKKYSNLKNIWFQVVKADGTSIYKSFSNKKGENILKFRSDMAKIVKNPQIITSISVGKFSMSIKALVPVYDNNKFIGIVETIGLLESIVSKMEKLHYKTIVFVDKSYKKQLILADKDKFLENYFIAAWDKDTDLLEYIKSQTVEHFIHCKNPYVCKELNSLITVYTLDDQVTQKPMAYFIIAHNLKNIDIKDINQIRNNLFLILFGFLFSSLSLFVYFYIQSKKKLIENLNNTLEDTVQTKTQELSYLAHYDALTGLTNRHLFSNIIQSAIESSKKEGTTFFILFLDLDKFKDINDTYGHNVGDKLLVSVAKRLKSCVKNKDFISRFGGDEFVILIDNVDEIQLVSIVERIITQVQQPIEFEGNTLSITFSIGVSRFPKDGIDTESLLSSADLAMYKAKELGRNTFQFYDKKMSKDVIERLELEKKLKVALQEDQFEVFYQPQVDSQTNRVVGAEALIRWNSPELGMVSPYKFIPIAEETDLIIQIDTWMMKHSMEQLIRFQKEGIETGKISLNISARQLESKNIIRDLKATLDESNFDPKRVELEITERQMMKNPEASIVVLEKLKEMGLDIAVDDFGTGHSSLAYIKRLPIDKIKIDKSFVDELPYDAEDSAIVRSIISIAKNLHINIIAEGVENEEQRDFLKKEGCSLIQGYFYAKPLRADEYKQFLLKFR